MLDKLWSMGLLKQNREQGAGLSRVEREITVSAFARRRLGVLMARAGMVEDVQTVRIISRCIMRMRSHGLELELELERERERERG